MATRVPKDDLEQVMNAAGVGERIKKKLRRANEPTPVTRGHGTPGEKRSLDLGF